MVRVPEYVQSVSLRPAERQGIDVQASPDAFGASIGKGMAGLGKGALNLSESVSAVDDLDNTLSAKDRLTKYQNWEREAKYGQGGFMTLEGKAAIDGRAAFEKLAEEKRREFGQDLSPGAALKYTDASRAAVNATLQQSIVHAATQRKQWFNETGAARMKSMADEALVNYNNPAAAEKSIALSLEELKEQAKAHGWSPETLKARAYDSVSDMRKNIALRIAQDDPIAADKYVNENKAQISGAHQAMLAGALKQPLKEEQAKRYAADWNSQAGAGGIPGGGGGSGEPTFNMIARFEGFRTNTYWDVNHHRVGYGSDTITRSDGSVVKVQQGMTVSRDDADRDLSRRIGQSQQGIINSVGRDKWDGLSAAAKAAVTSVAYNYGSLPFSVANAIATGGPPEIAGAIRGLSGHNAGVNAGRRAREAAAVESGRVDMAALGQRTQNYFTGMESFLSQIKDPDVQEMVRKRINAMLDVKNKAAQENERSAKAELWRLIDQGATPDQIPFEVKQAAGMSAMSAAWGYVETVNKGREVKSDETLLYDMRRLAAMRPNDFAGLDLNDYRDRLSKDAIKELTGLQTTALTDQRKAREDGLTITTAFSQATQQLEAAGITATGKTGKAAQEANQRIATFQNSLAAEMETFKRNNADKKPTQMDVQAMINKLLLPVVIKTPGIFFDTTDDTKRLFEAASRPDDATVSVNLKYGDIPIDLRRGITTDLERELGRKPSQTEVVERYKAFVTTR